MAQTDHPNPGELAKQFLEEALHKAEEHFAADMQSASETRKRNIAEAKASWEDVVRNAREALQIRKKHLAEAFDKESRKQRRHEEKAERTIQEQRLIRADDDRARTILKAGDTYKRQIAEAAENRKHAIKQAKEDGKRLKRETEESIKQQKAGGRLSAETERKSASPAEVVMNRKEEARVVAETERKAARAAEQQSIEMKNIAIQKAVDDKRMKTEAEKTASIAAEAEKRAAKAAAQEAAEIKIKEIIETSKLEAQKEADEKRMKMEAEESSKKQKEAARAAAKAERKAAKGLEKGTLPPVAVSDTPAKPGNKGVAVNRNSMVKITISRDSADAVLESFFESSLRDIPGLKIVMVSGDTNEGTQILVSAENPLVVSERLRELPIVKELENRRSDIMVTLQPQTVLKVNL